MGLEPAAPQLHVDSGPLASKSAGFPLPKPEMGYAFWQLGICARRLGALTEVLALRK